MTNAERVEVLEIDDYTEPAAEPGYYAIYLRLSRAPGAEWRAHFEREWRRIPTGLKRAASIVQNRLRIEIHGDDMVQEMVNFGVELVERTNRAIARSHQKVLKENDPED